HLVRSARGLRACPLDGGHPPDDASDRVGLDDANRPTRVRHLLPRRSRGKAYGMVHRRRGISGLGGAAGEPGRVDALVSTAASVAAVGLVVRRRTCDGWPVGLHGRASLARCRLLLPVARLARICVALDISALCEPGTSPAGIINDTASLVFLRR